MLVPKNLLKITGSLLLVSTIVGAVKFKTLHAATNSDQLIHQPLQLAAEGDRDVVLISTPSLKQVQEFVQTILPTHPDAYGYRRVYSPQFLRLNPTGKQTPLSFTRHPIIFQDRITAKPITLDLLSFDTPDGQRWIPEPGTSTPPLLPNPKNPSQLLVLPNQSGGPKTLTLVDGKTLTVQQPSIEGYREAITQIRNQHPGEDNPGFPTWVTNPNWSPDGRYIAFSSDRNHEQTKDANLAIWLHDVRTGQDIKLLGSETQTFICQGWTADGRILATAMTRENRVNSSSESLVAIHLANQQQEKIADGHFLALSDDGETLIYLTRSDQSTLAELFALSLTTGKKTRLYQETEQEHFTGVSVDFSADGDRLVFTLGDTSGFQQTLLIYDFDQQQTWRFPVPEKRQIVDNFGGRVEWVGNRLLVPLIDPQQGISDTLLLSPDIQD